MRCRAPDRNRLTGPTGTPLMKVSDRCRRYGCQNGIESEVE